MVIAVKEDTAPPRRGLVERLTIYPRVSPRQQNGTLAGCSSPGQSITINDKKLGRV
jgi:hypothetical protein